MVGVLDDLRLVPVVLGDLDLFAVGALQGLEAALGVFGLGGFDMRLCGQRAQQQADCQHHRMEHPDAQAMRFVGYAGFKVRLASSTW